MGTDPLDKDYYGVKQCGINSKGQKPDSTYTIYLLKLFFFEFVKCRKFQIVVAITFHRNYSQEETICGNTKGIGIQFVMTGD
jgi:hypothetical protein